MSAGQFSLQPVVNIKQFTVNHSKLQFFLLSENVSARISVIVNSFTFAVDKLQRAQLTAVRPASITTLLSSSFALSYFTVLVSLSCSP